MAENPQFPTNIDGQNPQSAQKPIETVAKTLVKSQAKQKYQTKLDKNYDALYKDIKSVLSQFDSSIGDCKKYNEAKIHRKYEIIISDLQAQVRVLRQKLRQEQNARSPSKKYIEDLVDQLVVFKLQNQRLKLSIQQANTAKQNLQKRLLNLTIQIPETPKLQKILPSQRTARQVTDMKKQENQLNIKIEVLNFLKKQQQARRLNQQPKTKFESFLKRKLQDFQQYTFLEFLTQINKWWISCEKAKQDKLSNKLKSNVLSTLQDEIGYNKKLPKIVPYSTPGAFHQALSSQSQMKKSVKKRQANKSRQIYSTIQVVDGYRQKYALK